MLQGDDYGSEEDVPRSSAWFPTRGQQGDRNDDLLDGGGYVPDCGAAGEEESEESDRDLTAPPPLGLHFPQRQSAGRPYPPPAPAAACSPQHPAPQRRSEPAHWLSADLPSVVSSSPQPRLRFPARPAAASLPAPPVSTTCASPPELAPAPAFSSPPPPSRAPPEKGEVHSRRNLATSWGSGRRGAEQQDRPGDRRSNTLVSNPPFQGTAEVPATVRALRGRRAAVARRCSQAAARSEACAPATAPPAEDPAPLPPAPADPQPAAAPAAAPGAPPGSTPPAQHQGAAPLSTPSTRRCATRARRRRKKARESRVLIYMNRAAARPVVLAAAAQMHLEFVPLRDYAQLLWVDRCVSVDTVKALADDRQRINRIPGMRDLCCKVLFTHHMNRMRALFPSDFGFYPQTFCLPGDEHMIEALGRRKKEAKRKKSTGRDSSNCRPRKQRADAPGGERERRRRERPTWIVKPSKGCQGCGIFLTQNLSDLDLASRGEVQYVVQRYIDNPLLIDGLKFDLRLYVLVLGVDPMHLYLSRDGLARFATNKYRPVDAASIGDAFMHLTNYSLNKDSINFVPNTDAEVSDCGSKRSVDSVMERIQEMGHDTGALWAEIKNLVVQTMLTLQPSLVLNVESVKGPNDDNWKCFHVLGFDVMLDDQLKPWILEVNAGPSLECDSPLDFKVKEAVVGTALRLGTYGLAHSQPASKRPAHEAAHRGRFDAIWPRADAEQRYAHLKAFNQEMRRCFDTACGLKRGEMGSGRFCKFFRDCGIVRSFRQMADSTGESRPAWRSTTARAAPSAQRAADAVAADEEVPDDQAAPADADASAAAPAAAAAAETAPADKSPADKTRSTVGGVRETKAFQLRKALAAQAAPAASTGAPPQTAEHFPLRLPPDLAEKVQTFPHPEIELLFLKRTRGKPTQKQAAGLQGNPGGEHSGSALGINFFEFLTILIDLAGRTYAADEFSGYSLLDKLRLLVTPARGSSSRLAAAPAKG
eukprot:TRINITY_DN10421_c0_g2_i2.p1 TRINITY_DN10421_c0_g2~~TRINITY_DN10421_c0_g2_i2.p1  ORF type:complete len:1013 (+),score=297.14 TRINITY_DN10421_c0_g2_i2:79-3039(+)